MILLPNNIIIKIFNHLDHEDLMKMYNMNEHFKNIIFNNIWPNITIKLVKHKRINKFIDSGFINCFVNYDLSNSEITDSLLKYFSHCHTLDLTNCKLLTTDGLKYIEKCTIISN